MKYQLLRVFYVIQRHHFRAKDMHVQEAKYDDLLVLHDAELLFQTHPTRLIREPEAVCAFDDLFRL